MRLLILFFLSTSLFSCPRPLQAAMVIISSYVRDVRSSEHIIEYFENGKKRIDHMEDGRIKYSKYFNNKGFFYCTPSQKSCQPHLNSRTVNSLTHILKGDFKILKFRYYPTRKSKIILGKRCQIFKEELVLATKSKPRVIANHFIKEKCQILNPLNKNNTPCMKKKIAWLSNGGIKAKPLLRDIAHACSEGYVLEETESLKRGSEQDMNVKRALKIFNKKVSKNFFKIPTKYSTKKHPTS